MLLFVLTATILIAAMVLSLTFEIGFKSFLNRSTWVKYKIEKLHKECYSEKSLVPTPSPSSYSFFFFF